MWKRFIDAMFGPAWREQYRAERARELSRVVETEERRRIARNLDRLVREIGRGR